MSRRLILTEKSLEVARQRAQVFGARRIACASFEANAEQLSRPCPVEPYDLIYSFGVIHHTPHPDRVLEEIRKLCHSRTARSRSWCTTAGPGKCCGSCSSTARASFWRLNRLIAEYSEAQTGCPVTYSYSRAGGRRLLGGHGFRVTDVMVDHIFPYSIPEYVEYQYKKVWYFRWMPRAAFSRPRARLWLAFVPDRQAEVMPGPADAHAISLLGGDGAQRRSRRESAGSHAGVRKRLDRPGAAATIPSELIIVEWNPPADRARLAERCEWPEDLGPCQVRLIEVPAELHQRFAHAERCRCIR